MTANKNLMGLRKLGKLKLVMEMVTKNAIAYAKALVSDQYLPFPVHTMQVKLASEMQINMLAAIPAKYFRPDGSIDKRRQRLGEFRHGKTFIIKGNS